MATLPLPLPLLLPEQVVPVLSSRPKVVVVVSFQQSTTATAATIQE